MRFDRDSLRAGRIHYLLDLEWGGVTYRLSRERVTAPAGEDGAEVDYWPGLVVDNVAHELRPFADSLEERTVPMTLYLGDLVDVAARVQDGYPLTAAQGTLRLWLEGTTELVTLILGEIRTPDYGNREEAVTLTLEEAPWIAPALLPAEGAAINSTTWPNHDPERAGDRYPLVLGEPGGSVASDPHGGPAYYVDTAAKLLLVAGHRVAASQVRIINIGGKQTATGTLTVTGVPLTLGDTITIGGVVLTGVAGARTSGSNDFSHNVPATEAEMALEIADAINDTANSFSGLVQAEADGIEVRLSAVVEGAAGNLITLAESSTNLTRSGATFTGGLGDEVFSVTHQADGLGRLCAVVDVSGATEVEIKTGGDYAVSWGTGSGGGMLRRDGSGVAERRAGRILEWMLEWSGVRFDRGRLAASRAVLDRYLVDATFSAPPDKRVSPWDWIQDHLTPILPISWYAGPGGIYPVVWRYFARPQDALVTITTPECERVDVVKYLDQDPAQEVTVAYALDFTKGRPRATAGLSGDPSVYGSAPGISPDGLLRRSWKLHARETPARKRSIQIKAEVVKDATTAQMIAAWRARRHALVPRSFLYRCPPWAATVEPGDPVLLTDGDLSLSELLCLVSSVDMDATGWVNLGLTEAYP